MKNEWNLPEGYAVRPAPVRYRLSGVVYQTVPAVDPVTHRWHHALAPETRVLAIAVRELVQRACGYFYEPDATYVPLPGVQGVVVSDDEVRERVRRLDLGENLREAVRTSMRRYPLQELPWDQQRALVEGIEEVKRVLGFELIGEVEPSLAVGDSVYLWTPDDPYEGW